jgi:hypothetical protein
VLYFLVVFGAGFVLGPIRIIWLAPRLGERWAELVEMPVMLCVIVAAARWVVRRHLPLSSSMDRLRAGGLALVLMLAAEFSLVLWLRGITLGEYFATRDPVSGAAYYFMLAVFAAMPALVRR